LMPPSL